MAKRLARTRHGDISTVWEDRRRTCKECGKEFYVDDIADYAYKTPKNTAQFNWFCCYTHWRNNGGQGGNTEYKRRIASGELSKRRTAIKHK